MNFSFITEYPSWLIVICILTGAAYAWLLYRKGASVEGFRSRVRKMIAAARFITVSVLCFLLLGPMIRTIKRTVEKPVIIVAIDNSGSVIAGRDSAERKKQVEQLISRTGTLNGDYELHTLLFGDKVKESNKPDFNDRLTDFTNLYDEINVQFLNRNVGAVIVASDGIYNSGSSPVSGPSRVKAPMYTIALGDTTISRDLILSGAEHNKTAFLGNSFPINVKIDARQAAGSQSELTVEEEGTIITSRPVIISGNRYHTSVPIYIDAKTKGLKHYKLSLKPINGEATLSNNSRDIYIDVIESRQKVLIVAAAPHPDIAALRSAIESAQNYEVTVAYANDFNGNTSGSNLIILHGLPGADMNRFREWEKKWENDEQSVWYFITGSTNINSFNNLQTGITVTGANNSLNEVQAIPDNGFSLFTVSNELQNAIGSWPPVNVPFGIYKMESSGYNLFSQRIGSVVTGQPLFSFLPGNNGKKAVFCGEGIWRWKLAEYEQTGNSIVFRELISRTVQYLASTGNKSPFRLQYKNSYNENEPVVFNAELFDASGQLVNTPDVKMTITSSGGRQFNFAFSRTDKSYILNAGLLPPGRYRFKAETKLGDKIYAENGEFSVNALQLELVNTVADHQVLYATASRNGGAMFYPGQEDQLLKAIESREDITAVSYMEKKLSELVEQPWVFILIMLLLTIEWFVRKRSGIY